MIVTLLIIWSAVLTIWCWVLSRVISELNNENENMYYCMKNLIKAWQVHNMERRKP